MPPATGKGRKVCFSDRNIVLPKVPLVPSLVSRKDTDTTSSRIGEMLINSVTDWESTLIFMYLRYCGSEKSVCNFNWLTPRSNPKFTFYCNYTCTISATFTGYSISQVSEKTTMPWQSLTYKETRFFFMSTILTGAPRLVFLVLLVQQLSPLSFFPLKLPY